MRPLQIGFIGVGQMGRPMVDRLIGAGWQTKVFVRRADQRAELEAAGIAVADSAVALAADVDLLILCLFSDGQVRESVIESGALAAMKPGSVVVCHTTGSPDQSPEMQASAPDGVTVLDVPISGTADHVRSGQLTLLVGGDAAALERVRAALASYADPILEVGGLGDGQRIKLINNLLFTVHLRVGIEAAALAESIGIPATEFSRIVSACSGDSFVVRMFRDVRPQAMGTSAKHFLAKDVEVVRAVADEQHIDLGLLGELAGWVFEG